MSADTEPLTGQRYSLFWCHTCGKTVACNRVEILGFLRSSWPMCCQSEMGLFIEAERPIPGDTRVVAEPLMLPGSNEGTAIIPVPTPRTPR